MGGKTAFYGDCLGVRGAELLPLQVCQVATEVAKPVIPDGTPESVSGLGVWAFGGLGAKKVHTFGS